MDRAKKTLHGALLQCTVCAAPWQRLLWCEQVSVFAGCPGTSWRFSDLNISATSDDYCFKMHCSQHPIIGIKLRSVLASWSAWAWPNKGILTLGNNMVCLPSSKTSLDEFTPFCANKDVLSQTRIRQVQRGSCSCSQCSCHRPGSCPLCCDQSSD